VMIARVSRETASNKLPLVSPGKAQISCSRRWLRGMHGRQNRLSSKAPHRDSPFATYHMPRLMVCWISHVRRRFFVRSHARFRGPPLK
jgi:hypothetical protein